MERLKSFDELFISILRREDGILRSGQKFLGVFDGSSLPQLEELLQTDLGTRVGRRRRPFIAMFQKVTKSKTYLIAFLSKKNYSGLPVDLGLCNRYSKNLCAGLDVICYVLKDRKREKVLVYEIPMVRFEELKFEFCGSCTDMDWLEKLGRGSII